ncbi:MAG: MFS transporter [bacterium]|nr:MFS transporter [bacterium]
MSAPLASHEASNPAHIPKTVIALGLVSFFTDLSSEMIYPLLPLFLSSALGAGAFALGLIEGIAEATASALKITSGYLADKLGKKKPFVLAGYSLSSAVRPLIGLATSWPVVLILRFMDRVGKGIRTSPRDALIAEVTRPELRGRAYGFHRAMDHAGAVFGPLAAVLVLKGFGLPLRVVFFLSALPGIVVVMILILFVPKERKKEPAAINPSNFVISRQKERCGDAGEEAERKTPQPHRPMMVLSLRPMMVRAAALGFFSWQLLPSPLAIPPMPSSCLDSIWLVWMRQELLFCGQPSMWLKWLQPISGEDSQTALAKNL